MFKKMLVTLFVSLSLLAMTTATFAQGRKMGLFVGINEYQGGIKPLKSCVNDAVNMQMKLSRKYGFEASNMSLLKDAQATRQAILQKLTYYEQQTANGDLFVFYYSGHGSVFPDALSDDQDETQQFGMPGYFPAGYYDSALVPVDARDMSSGKAWDNLILDDELNAIFSRFTAKGVQVIFISDSCHSGTLAKDLGSNNNGDYKFVAPKTLGFNSAEWKNAASRPGRKSSENFSKLFLVIGSSQDNQFSRAGGSQEMSLFTKIFIAKLDEYASGNKNFTYQSVIDSVRPEVNNRSDSEQTPLLDARFFQSSLLNKPIFSLLSASSNSEVQIAAKVTDETGSPIYDASFGVFRAGSKIGKDEISKNEALMLGKTNNNGLFDSGNETLKFGSKTLPIGRYQIKVVKKGYQAYIRDMDVTQTNKDKLVFIFKLVRE